MSKEFVRQLVTARFNAMQPLKTAATQLKSFPNLPDMNPPALAKTPWMRLRDIDFVLHKVASIGAKPCTRRTGVIVIDAFVRSNDGTKDITELTDRIEEHFGLWDAGNFWTDPANTVNLPTETDNRGYYQSTVYIPFTYDP